MGIEIISNGNDKYTLKFTAPKSGMRSYSHNANSIVEVHNAIDHYMRPSNTDHRHVEGNHPDCPLCLSMKTKERELDSARLTFENLCVKAESKGLILEKRVMYENGKVIQRYSLTDNDKGVETGVLTLSEVLSEIEDKSPLP